MSVPLQLQRSSYRQARVLPGVRRKPILRELVPKASKTSKGDHVEELYDVDDGWASKDYDGIAKEVEGALRGLRQKRVCLSFILFPSYCPALSAAQGL
jgi:hypothetical protein